MLSENVYAFLRTDGEMPARIREFDWAGTRMGALETWPAAVRSVVGVILRSPLPVVTLWGEAGVMIYNDAYAIIAGARHPTLLGSDVRAGWPEVADFNDQVLRRVYHRGETLSFRDQELTLDRGGGPAPAWMDLDYSPVVDDDGAPLGVIAFVVETTARVAADRRLQDERLRLQQVFDQSPSFMALLEGPAHRIVLTNPAYRTLIGHRDAIGRTARDGLAEGGALGPLEKLDDVFTSGRPYKAPETAYPVQARPGGPFETRYIEFVCQPITDAEGAVRGILLSGEDVTERRIAREAIREREIQFRTFAEVMPNLVWMSRPDGRMDWVNERFIAYSGFSAEALIDQGWRAVVDPADRDRASAGWLAALEAGSPYETELRLMRPRDAARWHLVRALPVRNESGDITRWIATSTDIHDQKLAEVRTLEDRDRLWTLSQDLMLICDYEGVITAVNPSAERLLGWRPREMVGKQLSAFLHPDDVALTEMEVRKLASGATTRAFENRYRHKSTGYRLIDWTAVPDGGRIHAIGRDISEERRLARERERIWNLSPVLKVTTSLSGIISSVNPAWTHQLGWTEEECLQCSVMAFVQRAYRRELRDQVGRLVEGAASAPFNTVVKTKSGDEKIIEWTTVREGDTLFGFGRDMTDEMEASAALAASETALRQAQKMEAIGQLTGGIAHDFNNLLQVVGGNLQLLSESLATDEKGRQRLQNAMEGVHRGARLASQLLAFGRRQPLAPKVVNLGRLVRSMDEMLRHTLGEAVEIETRVVEDLWNTVIDPGNVENALLNLAINARDAMAGSGKLTIEIANTILDNLYGREHPDVTPGEYVVLAVTDTGTGMPPEVLARVFDPFYSTKPEGKGSGLGLSMVYGFVKQTGGHIRIYSEVGVGTTIRIYLPRSLQPEDEIVRPREGPVAGGTETILVVEDDPGVRDTVVQTLTELGYTVLQASDAASALAIVESGRSIDLLFTDVVMPGPMKSTELARQAVSHLPALSVLFTSGYPEHSIVHAGRLEAGVELLSKPYSKDAMARRIRHQLDQRAGSGAKAEPAPAPASAPVRPQRTPGLRILLCEDDVLIRMSTVDMLEEAGHTVFEAGHGRAALRVLSENVIDILLTDVGLPDMKGTELARRAREVRADLPVIFVTGLNQLEDSETLERVALVRKPYESPALHRAINSLWETGALPGGATQGD